LAEDAPEGGEGRIVERRRDGDAEQHPHREIGNGMIGIHDQGQAERAQERADRHHPVSAEPIDQEAHPR